MTKISRSDDTGHLLSHAYPQYLGFKRVMNYTLKVLQLVFFSSIILYVGQAIWIPLSFALLISFILYPACHWLEQHRVPRVLSISIVIASLTAVLSLLVALLAQQFYNFVEQWPVLSEKIRHALDQVFIATENFFNLNQHWWQTIFTNASQHLVQELPQTLYNTSVSTLLFLLVPVYTALILYYRDLLVTFTLQFTPKQWIVNYKQILTEVVSTYFSFIKGMIFVYLTVGMLNSLGLWMIGVPQAFFFGFVASILTFIPYVGIVVGALLPITIAWLTFDSILYPLGVIMVFLVVQVLEANIIFPVAVSYKLRINTLATLVAIVAGGILWGAAGMILFIPFLAILKLIAEKVDHLHALAILLGTPQDVKKYQKADNNHSNQETLTHPNMHNFDYVKPFDKKL